MSQAIDLSHIYKLRNDFTIVGLTGQIGSGCSEVADQLVKGFNEGKDFEDPFIIGFEKSMNGFTHNSYRKYRIIYNYAEVNFKNYSLIKYKDVLIIFLLQHSFKGFVDFLKSPELENEFLTLGLSFDFNAEISGLQSLEQEFIALAEKFKSIDVHHLKENNAWETFYEFYFNSDFKPFCTKLFSIFNPASLLKRNKLLQIIATNLRMSGNPYKFSEANANNIFTIVELINDIIKSHGKHAKKNGEKRTQIVIDSLRNPIEIMFFKQRFAAFYTIAINREDISRDSAITSKYTYVYVDKKIKEKFLKEEYKGGSDDEFYRPNISACIQQADIHITFLTEEEAGEKNKKLKAEKTVTDNTSPYFSWKMQLLKYVSLISHPGIVTPSPEERCMQLAYTAKHNSGCISRHVGAAITDENYSIKAIGWNNTPAGQVPCVLRCAKDIIDVQSTSDLAAFTNYEKENEFTVELIKRFEKPIEQNKKNLNGRNECFCFKDIKNSYSEGKNQVHTRSLHAEESAFLQITKYGGVGIQNGKLFTTASPCELCAKKAYQLGIKVIYYIDPYPGISLKQILSAGSNPIEVRLFNGAIGNAYHWLYDPIMPYKNELTLLLGNKFKDFASQQKEEANKYKEESKEKDKKIAVLEQRIQELENKGE